MAMGTADIIPGVSGGTIALILGVYTELIDTIKGVTPHILLLLLAFMSDRSQENAQAIKTELRRLNLGFALTLGAGIFTAIVIGSMTIPPLMEAYPEAMRALFFGLIVASVFVPFRMIEVATARMTAIVAFCAALGAAFGFAVTDPSHVFEPGQEWTSVEARGGETLKDVTRRAPSAMSSEQVYWAEENSRLRATVARTSPELAADLAALHEQNLEPTRDKATLKTRAKPYDQIVLPEGTPVEAPRPALWFVFFSGLIAICAMILPGISGSYILLILDVYFFILNALKGFVTALASGQFPVTQLSYVAVFCVGCAIGLLGFARVLSTLLEKYPPQTLGVLVGLMLGCLRGIWPFRRMEGAVEVNIMPATLDSTVISAIVAGAIGFAIVAIFTYVGHVRSQGAAVHEG